MASVNYTIRPMENGDLDSVLRIEEDSFNLPFSRGLFEKFMRQEDFYCWVALHGEELVGYAVYAVAADEVDLLNIAIDKRWRRRGIGSLMVRHILEQLMELGSRRIFLEVRPSNTVAMAFYDKLGFFQIGIRPGYYHDSGEDALVYSRDIR